MNRSLLPQLREIKVVDRASALMYLRVALAIFGYTSISRQEVSDYQINMLEEAGEYGWDVRGHTLVFGITINKRGDGSFLEVPFKPKIKAK